MANKHIGSVFDEFLHEQGILAQTQAEAIKRVLAWQIRNYLDKEGITKSAFASMLNTSRSQLDRLLDPEYTRINLTTLSHVAEVMGKHIELRIVD